jgi:hypothetical protein
VEKLHARGYEVLLVNEGLDEIMFQNIRQWKCVIVFPTICFAFASLIVTL